MDSVFKTRLRADLARYGVSSPVNWTPGETGPERPRNARVGAIRKEYAGFTIGRNSDCRDGGRGVAVPAVHRAGPPHRP